MPRKKASSVETVTPTPSAPSNMVNELASALTAAIETARPTKKNVFNRFGKTPWDPKDGSPKLKLKRKFYQHGLLVMPEFLDNEEIALINQLKPGRFCNDYIKVVKRRDKGIDLDYPVKESTQRLKLVSQFGLRNLKEILAHCIEEAKHPRVTDADGDDLD